MPDRIIVDSLILKARSQAIDVKRLSKDACNLIGPSDSARVHWSDVISKSVDDIVFYIDKYLNGDGIAYLDKAEVTSGHAWTFCLDALSLPEPE